jgi:hypothetical protein
VVTQKVDIRKYLYDKDLDSKLTYLSEYQDLVGMQQEAVLQKSKYQEADAAVAALSETRAQSAEEYRRIRFEELSKAEQKVAGLAQDVIKAEQRTKFLVLTEPVEGVVQQLALHTVGGVVTPGQALLAVVPLDSHLEIEAIVRTVTSVSFTPGRMLKSRLIPSASPAAGFCTARSSTSLRTPSPETDPRIDPATRRWAPRPPAVSLGARR